MKRFIPFYLFLILGWHRVSSIPIWSAYGSISFSKPDDRMTIASLLQSQGYKTSMVGKWHLGFDESKATYRPGNLQGGPNVTAAYRENDAD